MDLRQLRYLLRIADARSVTRAAAALNLVQPALSQQIRKLEDEIGEPLLVRHARGVTLTEAGERLVVHARAIIEQLEAARRDIDELKAAPHGKVRLGLPSSVSQMLALTVMADAREKIPGVAIAIVEQHSGTINEQMLDRRLDLALTYNGEAVARLDQEPVLTERLCLVAPVNGPLRERREITLKAAAALPLILPSEAQILRRRTERAAAQAGVALNIAHEIDSVPVAAEMVEAGFGCAILPFPAVERAVARGRLRALRIMRPQIERRLSLVYPPNLPPSRAQRAVRDVVMAAARRYAAAPRRAAFVILPPS